LDRKGTISLIITAQKYKLLPTVFRTCYTGLFLFKVNGEDWRGIKEDNVYDKHRTWDKILSDIFTEDSRGMRPFLYINK